MKLLGKEKNLELSYKVRGNFSPNGLQKVFFSFHPADFGQMKKIIDDILKMADCVAYYHSDDVSADELNIDDCSLKLSEMKLFVVIVSTNYLMYDSFAKSWEYGFAVTNNIPILPITVEPGLESSFTVVMNQIGKGYGDRQLLNSTYNPLGIKKQRFAEMIEDTRDEVRRFEAIVADYDSEPDFAELLEAEDEAKYEEMQKMHKAMVIGYCDYVRERLKEHIGNPTANNALSKEICETILARLDREQACMEGTVSEDEQEAATDDAAYTAMLYANKATA